MTISETLIKTASLPQSFAQIRTHALCFRAFTQSEQSLLYKKLFKPVKSGAFVVSPEKEEVLRVLDLVGEEKQDGLNRVLAAVDVVAQEEVVRVRRVTALFEMTYLLKSVLVLGPMYEKTSWVNLL